MAFESDLAEVTNGGKIAVTVQTDMKKNRGFNSGVYRRRDV